LSITIFWGSHYISTPGQEANSLSGQREVPRFNNPYGFTLSNNKGYLGANALAYLSGTSVTNKNQIYNINRSVNIINVLLFVVDEEA
jgi:hypothetical protein